MIIDFIELGHYTLLIRLILCDIHSCLLDRHLQRVEHACAEVLYGRSLLGDLQISELTCNPLEERSTQFILLSESCQAISGVVRI